MLAAGFDSLAPDLIKILFGFGLTAVLGSWITRHTQQRSWNRQWLVQRRAEDLKEMTAVFDELSRLLDRRWYRSAKLLWALRSADDETVESALSEYRLVLFAWNDNINRTLAQLQIHFSAGVRRQLDDELGRRLVELGAGLEDVYRCREKISKRYGSLVTQLEEARLAVYDFNLHLLGMIAERRSSLLGHVTATEPGGSARGE